LNRLERERLPLPEFIELDPVQMAECSGLTRDQAQLVRASEQDAARTAEQMDDHRIRVLRSGSPAYPERLLTVLRDQAPAALFAAGAIDLLSNRGVGFCGARDASEMALRCADQVARALVKHRLLVVSGHAAGVDETAHRAALESGGNTALVLPEGILRFRARASIRGAMTDDNAVIVSEFSPNAPWSVGNAMQRNRTICGLVNAMIVIEAGTSGGTWEAGLSALQLGVPLFVLDYSNPAPSGAGNPLLLKKGGKPLPCRTGHAPDLTLLLSALDLPLRSTARHHPTWIDSLQSEP
jgi:DNA processing protein